MSQWLTHNERQMFADIEDVPFPQPPVPGSPQIAPLDSWAKMYRETREMGIEFDAFWYESVMACTSYFFHWVGPPPATVLVVFDHTHVLWIESKTLCDRPLAVSESSFIESTLLREFMKAGYLIERPLVAC